MTDTPPKPRLSEQAILNKRKREREYYYAHKEEIAAKRHKFYMGHRLERLSRPKKRGNRVWEHSAAGIEYNKNFPKRPEQVIKHKIRGYDLWHFKKTNICTKCGKVGKTHIHHYKYEIGKVQELCPECHFLVHKIEKREKLGIK